MNYTLNQLRIFLKVSELKSVTKAAEALHLTQPAVSIQLKNFQDQFKIPLIEVVNKKIYVTEFGHRIIESAKKIIAELELIDYQMHAHKGFLTGQLKFSAVSTGKYVAPYFISSFLKSNPGVTLNLDVTNKAQVVESLSANLVDFAFVSVLPQNLQIESMPLLRNKLYLVGNRDHTLIKKKYDYKIFESLPLIFRESGSGTRHVMEKFFLENGISIKNQMELTSNEAVKQAVIAGLGFSVMPLIGIKNELELGQLQLIPVNGFPIESTWYLIWLRNKRLGPLAEAYLKYLSLQKTEIVNQVFSWTEKYS